MLRAPESHTVDPDFDDVTLSDLTNANPILATYVATAEPKVSAEDHLYTLLRRAG